MKRILLLLILHTAISANSYCQEIIKGIVKDDLGETLPGATIFIRGTNKSTVANANGQFSIEAVKELPFTLVINSVGFNTQEIEIYEVTEELAEIFLKTANVLNEVVVTAMGIENQRKAINYSVQTVKGSDITETREPNIVSAISGKVAGVQISNSSGQPGGSATIRVRGSTSILGDNSPLFVLDGLPIDNSNVGLALQNENQIVNQSNRAVDINANDIESITVLKGPTAAALYGIRAANGAVLLNTRKGSKGGPDISFSTSYSVETLLRHLQPTQNSFAQGINGKYVTPGQNGSEDSWGPLLDTLTYSSNPSKWDVNGAIVGQSDPTSNGIPIKRYHNIDNFFRAGYTWDNHLSVSGGSDRTTYYFSAGRFYQEGIVPTTDFFKNSVRLGGSFQASEKLFLSASVNYFNSGSNNRMLPAGAPSGVIRGLLTTPLNFDNANSYREPANNLASYQFEDGTQRAYAGGNRGFDNPFWSLNKNPHYDDINRFVVVQETNFEILDWLSATLRLGTDLSFEKRKAAFSKGSIAFPAGAVADYTFSRRDINTDLYLTANKQITSDLSLKVVAGHNFFDFYRFNNVSRGNNLSIPDFYNISNASSVVVDQSIIEKNLVAVYGDIQVSYKDWLFVGLSGRNEWTSTLPSGSNSFFYPSLNAGVVLSEALNLHDNLVSYLKVRGSVAQVGNDASPYSLATYYSTTSISGSVQGQQFNFPFRGLSGFSFDNNVVDPNLKPETITAYEAGTDIWFLNNKLGFELTFYKSRSRDQILPVSIPTSTGFAGYITNAGLIENRGVEIVLTATPIKTTDFNWEAILNFSSNRSEVIELADGLSQIGLWNTNNVTASIISGEAFSVFYGTQLLKSDNGEVIVDDRATLSGTPNANYGFPMIDPQQTVIGDPNPLFNAGLRNALNYKNFSLSFLFDTRYGFDIYNSAHAQMVTNGVSKITEDRYDPFIFNGVKLSDGGTNNIEVIKGEGWYRSTIQYPELYIEKNLWWIRLRDINLTWHIPKKWISPFGIQGLDVTLTGRNLFLSTNYSGQDPDINLRGGFTNGYGADFFNYPTSKSIGGGVKVKF